MTAESAPSPVRLPVPVPRIGLAQATALYTCAILGAGVLVLPGQVASLAGPASLVAWTLSALLGVPLAFTFAALASRIPDAGGVATYATRAFGPTIGAITGWWYFIAVAVGHTIVPLTAGHYLCSALGLGPGWAPIFGLLILAAVVAANLLGVAVGARLQIGLALGVAAILTTVIVVAVPQIRSTEFTPFAPAGFTGVGEAIVVLFFAFAGWEAVAHLSAEFRDVRTTLPRATLLTVLIVTVLYLGVAAAVVGTGTYGDPGTDRVSLGLIVEGGWGIAASGVIAVAAVVICLGTTHAFMHSISRLGFALGRDGWAPRVLAHENRESVPVVSVLTVGGIGALGHVGSLLLGWQTEHLVVIPAVLVMATYLIGTAAAVRLFSGRDRVIAGLALGFLIVTVPFAGWHILIPLGTAAVVAVAALSARRGWPRRARTPRGR